MKKKEKKKLKIAIASGKGGVGKSMLSSALGILFSKENKIVAIDCDVDAPNLAIWLGEVGNWDKKEKISVSEKPEINNAKLKGNPLKYAKKCRFGALETKGGKLKLNPFLCEGCGACEIFCPAGVIKMKQVKNGEIRSKKTKYDFTLFSGHLYPGETGSGKVVAELKRRTENSIYDKVIIDSSPGTGCPVIASLQDVDFVILITEPTPSGFSDLKRVLEVVNHFKIIWGMVINKYDINNQLADKMRNWAKGRFLGKISYDKKIFEAVSNLTPITETDLKAKKEIENIYKKTNNILSAI